jgi:hypothetical protein
VVVNMVLEIIIPTVAEDYLARPTNIDVVKCPYSVRTLQMANDWTGVFAGADLHGPQAISVSSTAKV